LPVFQFHYWSDLYVAGHVAASLPYQFQFHYWSDLYGRGDLRR